MGVTYAEPNAGGQQKESNQELQQDELVEENPGYVARAINFLVSLLPTTGIFRSSIDKLQEKIAKNPYYPFIPKSEYVLLYSVVNTEFYVSVGVLAMSVILLIAFLAGSLQSNAFFTLPFIGIIASSATAYNYRSTRHYRLFPTLLEYAFSHDNKTIVKDGYYNIYIRMKREVRESSSSKKYYFLVLGGYGIDTKRISGSTRSMSKLRALGQQIAANLDINYFDEANTSAYHQVRHFRPDKSPYELSGIQAGSLANLRLLAGSRTGSVMLNNSRRGSILTTGGRQSLMMKKAPSTNVLASSNVLASAMQNRINPPTIIRTAEI